MRVMTYPVLRCCLCLPTHQTKPLVRNGAERPGGAREGDEQETIRHADQPDVQFVPARCLFVISALMSQTKNLQRQVQARNVRRLLC